MLFEETQFDCPWKSSGVLPNLVCVSFLYDGIKWEAGEGSNNTHITQYLGGLYVVTYMYNSLIYTLHIITHFVSLSSKNMMGDMVESLIKTSLC